MWRFYIENILAIAGFAFFAWQLLRADENSLPKLEKLTRNRIAGLAIALPALIVCVPHAEVVSPNFLLPLLWPIAIIFPILCFFYIDYYAARAFAGAMIIYAYDLVHFAYELKLPGAAVITVTAWLTGLAGICFSGRPCLMRDLCRWASRSREKAYIAAAAAAVPLAAALWTLLCRV